MTSVSRLSFRYYGSQRMYLALSYVKAYIRPRLPEFLYVSSAQIPPNISPSDVNDVLEQLSSGSDGSDASIVENSLYDSGEDAKSQRERRSEVYWKYKGEEALKNSGVPYSILRVEGFIPGGARSGKIELRDDGKAEKVTRIDVADAVVKCLGDETATNKVFYVGRGTGGGAKVSIVEKRDGDHET